MSDPEPEYSDLSVIAAIRDLIERCRSEQAAAKQLRVPLWYLSDVVHQRRAVPRKLAERLGFRRVVRYVRG